MMRMLLARAMDNIDAKAIQFRCGKYGKPSVSWPKHARNSQGQLLHFNLSHSQQYALLAIATIPVGIDIECQREGSRTINILSLAKRFFTTDEYNWLKNITNNKEQINAFFCLWTRKEALVKANGDGINSVLWSKLSCVPQQKKTIGNNIFYEEQNYMVMELILPVVCHAAIAVCHIICPPIHLHNFAL
ncbi:MAG: 4'-phosphopantetheinyl transferase superfamily protein [Mariprofundales bacterium]